MGPRETDAQGLVSQVVGSAMGAAAGLAPLFTLGSTVDSFDLGEPLSKRLHAAAFLLSVAVLYTFAFVYARRKREVDLLIMREASMFAFVATIIAAVVYGKLRLA